MYNLIVLGTARSFRGPRRFFTAVAILRRQHVVSMLTELSHQALSQLAIGYEPNSADYLLLRCA